MEAIRPAARPAISFAISGLPSLSYGTPAQGTVGQNYSLTPTFTGIGATFRKISGTLPTGTTLNANTGVISGTLTAANTFANIVIEIMNADGSFARVTISITVNAAPVVMADTLPDATAGQAYNEAITRTGGTGNGAWAVQDGQANLDAAGLELIDNGDGTAELRPVDDNPANLVVSASVQFTALFTDDNGVEDEQLFDVAVLSAFPAFTIYGSDGMSGTGNVHADTFDDEFGGDSGTWNSATTGVVVTETGGVATMPDSATSEVMLCTDAQWPSEPVDCGLLVQGFKGGGARACFMVDRRDAGNGDAICLQLEEDQKPKVVLLTASLVTPLVTEASVTEFAAADAVPSTEKNYLLRCIEVAGAGGGYTCELYEGTWEAGQSQATIEAGLTLIESVDIFTAAARAMRDSAGSTTRGMIRRADGVGTSCTFDGLHWGTF